MGSEWEICKGCGEMELCEQVEITKGEIVELCYFCATQKEEVGK